MRSHSPIALLLALAWLGCSAGAEGPEVVVWKTPTCGCCTKWADYLRANGFDVTTHDLPDLAAIKAEQGVPTELSACHTATVDGYVVEGHVPAEDVRRLLAERPDVTGLAVSGMPIGSPGMEGPNPEPYEVIAFKNGERKVFAEHGPAQ